MPDGSASRDALVLQWQYLPSHVVGKMLVRRQVRRLDFDDAMQIGYLALILAAECFDPTLGVQFQTYAYQSIWNMVYRTDLTFGIIRVPRGQGRANEAKLSRKSRQSMRRALQVQSLPEWYDQPSPCRDEAEVLADRELVERCLQALLPKERAVVVATIMEGKLLREVAREMGVTKQRVQQLRQSALQRMRQCVTETSRATPSPASAGESCTGTATTPSCGPRPRAISTS